MPYPIQAGWSKDDFKSNIIDHYFTTQGVTLQEKIDADKTLQVASKDLLIDDYCKLGSFFAANDGVLKALIPLEVAIRKELERLARQELKEKIINFDIGQAKSNPVTNYHGEPIYFKTHKLLSGVLLTAENHSGFNGFTTGEHMAMLHSMATVGAKGDDGFVRKQQYGFDMEPGGRTSSTKVALPSGVPGLTGGVGGVDFNRILLRHAYHWKDVGAGALGHGEYTHRIQWYAVTANRGLDLALDLANTPLQIFKSMGSLWARSTYPLKIEEQPLSKTYLWEAVFDCFKSSSTRTDGSIAYCDGTYNCPDNLNSELIKVGDRRYEADDPSNLFCLRVLMNARNFKRTKANEIDPLRRFMEDRKQVTEVYRQEGKDAYLVWYLTKDS